MKDNTKGLELYHVSNRKIRVPDLSHRSDSAVLGAGFYLFENKKDATRFINFVRQQADPGDTSLDSLVINEYKFDCNNLQGDDYSYSADGVSKNGLKQIFRCLTHHDSDAEISDLDYAVVPYIMTDELLTYAERWYQAGCSDEELDKIAEDIDKNVTDGDMMNRTAVSIVLKSQKALSRLRLVSIELADENGIHPILDFTLYHVSDHEVHIQDPKHIPAVREYGKGFYLFMEKKDAEAYAEKTGRHVINSYHFNIQFLDNWWIDLMNARILTTMFLNMEDDYLDELKDPSVDVEDLRGCDYFVAPMLQDGMKELEQKWKACEMPIDQCVDIAREMPFVQIMVLKTPKAFKKLKWVDSENV